MTPESQRLDLHGFGLHLLRWPGSDSALPPLLLLHGFLDQAWSWTWFQEELEALEGQRRTLLAPDFRGHGDSDRAGPGHWYYFSDYVGDIHGLLEALAIPRVDLVGHSMGGVVSSYLAGAFPERVRRLVLVEGFGPPDTPLADAPARLRSWAETRERNRTKGPRSFPSLDEVARRLRFHHKHLSEEQALYLAEKGTRPCEGGLCWKHDPMHSTRGAIPYFQHYHEVFLAGITSPTLLVNGRQGFLNMPGWEAREGAIAGAETVTLEGAGHMIHQERPAELAALVRDFMDRP